MKMRKTISTIVLLLFITLILTACSKQTDKEEDTETNQSSYLSEEALSKDLEEIENENLVHEHCTRAGNAGVGTKVNLGYDLYYQDDTLLLLQSIEELVTDNKKTLDKYENAYRKIHSNYKQLDNYIANVDRTDSSVASNIIIEYYKIDIDKLIEIEGEEDNIFENKVPKVSKWKELAEKFGTSCTKV